MYKQLQETEEQLYLLKTTDRPVVIWGTLTAGRMALEICRKLGVTVCAFVDNDVRKQGDVFQGIKIISADEMKMHYPYAVVMIGSFGREAERAISFQLREMNAGFTVLPHNWVAFFYEMLVVGRGTGGREKLWELQNDIYNDTEWRYGINRRIISEYRYKVTDGNLEELESIMVSVYGIKNLYIIIRTEELTEKVIKGLEKAALSGKAGHLVLVTDGDGHILSGIKGRLRGIFFYAKIREGCSGEFLKQMQDAGVIYELCRMPGNIFRKSDVKKREVTEQFMYDAVQLYITGEKDGKTVGSGKEVVIVQLFNGLANQMLMYLFGKFLGQYSGKEVIFDDTILSLDILDEDANVDRLGRWCGSLSAGEVREMVKKTREKNSFYCFTRAEVAEVFKLPVRLLSDYFDQDTWMLYLRKVKKELLGEYAQAFPLGQILMQSGADITVMQDYRVPFGFLDVHNHFCFDPHVLELPFRKGSVTDFIVSYNRTAYFMGIWTMGEMKDWLFQNREYVRETFVFSPPEDVKNRKYMEMIQGSDAVVIHIRRGDFVYTQFALDAAYVKDSVCRLVWSEQGEKLKFFVFSDDLDWCRNNMGELGLDICKDRTVFVEGNTGKMSYLDMYLMSLGKILVPSLNSTFSYMALLLSTRMEKCVDALQYGYFYRQGIRGRVEIVDVTRA